MLLIHLKIGMSLAQCSMSLKVCPQCSAVVSVQCAVTVAMNSHSTGKYIIQIIKKIYTVSADSMRKRAERGSELHEQIVSRMSVSTLRASETHAQILRKQAYDKKHMASLRAPLCEEVCQ